jgi:hypothetical protein
LVVTKSTYHVGYGPLCLPHHPPCSPVAFRTRSIAPSYIPRVPVNWSVCRVHHIARPYLPRACMYSPMAPLPPTPGLQPPGHIRPPPMLPRAIINALTNIQPLTVNWSVRHVPQIARGASPGHTCTPPRPTFLTQSSKATSKANWSTLLAYHADLGCPGLS